MENTVKKSPLNVFNCGPIKAAIWSDSRIVNGSLVDIPSIRIDKSYKDNGSDEWKYTNTFNVEDLPKVSVLAMEVYKFLRVKTSKNNNLSEQDNIQN